MIKLYVLKNIFIKGNKMYSKYPNKKMAHRQYLIFSPIPLLRNLEILHYVHRVYVYYHGLLLDLGTKIDFCFIWLR